MIGVFDSGLGGLTVVKSLKKQLPRYSFIYLGDTAHLPYGTKDPSLIRSWSQQNIEWLRKQGARIIVVACHTASTIVGERLEKRFSFPIFKMTIPLLEIVKAEAKNNRRLGIIGTPATIQSGFYQNKFKNIRTNIFFQACPLFVPLVEEGWVNKPGTEEIVRATLFPLIEKKIDTQKYVCGYCGRLVASDCGFHYHDFGVDMYACICPNCEKVSFILT